MTANMITVYADADWEDWERVFTYIEEHPEFFSATGPRTVHRGIGSMLLRPDAMIVPED